MRVVGPPRRPEIDQHAIKFIIGAIALSLPAVETILTSFQIDSISGSFWWPSPIDPSSTFLVLWPRSILVGSLLAIAAFMLTYNGTTEFEMWLTKIAALAACGVAMFPCDTDLPPVKLFQHVHLPAAITMYAVLTAFCLIFLLRARHKIFPEAKVRVVIYGVCTIGMVASIAFISFASKDHPKRVLGGETGGLVAFGISWLTASHILPFINNKAERKKMFE
jgi:hypothetical protein